MTACPQGCIDGYYGEDTMKLVEQERRLDVPEVIEVPSPDGVEEIVQTHYTDRYLQCRICGFVVDI